MMRRMMQIWVVAVLAIVVGAGRQARAEVDVVSWGQQTYDQGDLRERYVQVAAGWYHTLVLVTFTDCNSNGQRDSYEIMHGAPDINLNGVPDACEMRPGDLDLNNIIDFGDVALIMLDFGPCQGCLSDLDGSGVVDFGDVAIALLNFGPIG